MLPLHKAVTFSRRNKVAPVLRQANVSCCLLLFAAAAAVAAWLLLFALYLCSINSGLVEPVTEKLRNTIFFVDAGVSALLASC